jgi:EAL domain-containing protein (putative c-di-GMP-specific phosphodiesterase class I)
MSAFSGLGVKELPRRPQGAHVTGALPGERLADLGPRPLGQGVVRSDLARAPEPLARLRPELLHRQTAVLLAPGTARRIRPLFRELACASAGLAAEADAGGFESDHLLVRHFVRQLDRHLLTALPGEAARGGALDVCRAPGLHLNLAPASVLTREFEALADIARSRAASLGVEIDLVDAVADPDAFLAARARLGDHAIPCVLDHVPALALGLARLATLPPDLVKLDWSGRLLRLSGPEAAETARAIAELGPERIVLAGADREDALQWGLTAGIRRFQGRHIDAMLAAGRLAACPQAARCTLRQCIERASAAAPAGRGGCRNPALLDAGTPGPPS